MGVDTVAVIYKGEDYPLKLTCKRSNGKFYDLTGATEITVRFKQSGSLPLLEKKLTLSQVQITDALAGELLVSLSDTDTGTLLEKDFQDFDVKVDKGTATRIVYFTRKLSVKKALT